MEKDLGDLKAGLVDASKLAKQIVEAKDPSEAVGKVVGDVLIALLVPATRKMNDAVDRNAQFERNLHLAFALAAYQRDHGRYLNTLESLLPKYLDRIPGDILSGKALVYRPTAGGYLLYSVGINGQDDGGRTYDDTPPGDDLVIRVPLKLRS